MIRLLSSEACLSHASCVVCVCICTSLTLMNTLSQSLGGTQCHIHLANSSSERCWATADTILILHNDSQTLPRNVCVQTMCVCRRMKGTLGSPSCMFPPFRICYLYGFHSPQFQECPMDNVIYLFWFEAACFELLHAAGALSLYIRVKFKKCNIQLDGDFFSLPPAWNRIHPLAKQIMASYQTIAKQGLVSSCSIRAFSSKLEAFSPAFRS